MICDYNIVVVISTAMLTRRKKNSVCGNGNKIRPGLFFFNDDEICAFEKKLQNFLI